MFNMKFLKSIKEALDSKAVLSTKKSEELIESLATKELKIKQKKSLALYLILYKNYFLSSYLFSFTSLFNYTIIKGK